MDKIDYIIVSHNELAYLKLMWWSIQTYNSDIWALTKIKVFDSSTDGTREWLDQEGIPYEAVNTPDLYSTWNYAVSVTNNPLIMFSTSDHVLAPNFWKEILTQQSKHPEIHFFTGTCFDNGITYPHEDNVAVWGWPTNRMQFPIERRWFKRDCGDNPSEFSYDKFLQHIKDIGATKDITKMETSYCPFLTTRENFNYMGGFNLSLPYPKPADTDFLHRMIIAGRQFCVVDAAYEYHFSSSGRYLRNQ